MLLTYNHQEAFVTFHQGYFYQSEDHSVILISLCQYTFKSNRYNSYGYKLELEDSEYIPGQELTS